MIPSHTENRPHLSVVIPSFNEERNIERGVLDQVAKYLSTQSYTWEVIFTDDGSTDRTVDLLKKFVAAQPKTAKGTWKVQENIHAGKGPTVQAGMLAATGEWRLFTDFDQSTPLSEIEKLFVWTKDFPIVIGSREISGARREKEPFHRHLMGRGFNFLVQLLAIPGIYDTQCGFKLLSGEATDVLFPKMYVYGKRTARQDAFTGAFDVELLFLARKFGYEMKEVPIIWHHNETDRISPIKDSLRMLRDILRVRLADLSGAYRK